MADGPAAPSRAGRPAAGRPTIRPAGAADLPTVLELRLALLAEHHESLLYGRLRADVRERAESLYAAQLASAWEITLLAEVDRRVVGILRCLDAQGAPLLRPERYAYVSSVYVRPNARGRGVLRALLVAAGRWARGRGLDEMRLHNATDNPVATAVWEGLGFEAVEVLRIRRLAGGRRGGP